MKKICNKCNKEYIKKPNESKSFWSGRLYCSHSCANSVTSLGTKRCVGRIPWNKGIKDFNSGINSPSWKGGELSKVCKMCNSLYTIKRYRNDISYFCSDICRWKSRDQGKSTIYKKIRQSLEYEQWRTKVFERDLYTCQHCYIVGGYLQADHIQPFAFYPELRFDLSNGRTLCLPCHKKTDTYGVKAWRKTLIKSSQEA